MHAGRDLQDGLAYGEPDPHVLMNQDDEPPLSGKVEADETFFGGKRVSQTALRPAVAPAKWLEGYLNELVCRWNQRADHKGARCSTLWRSGPWTPFCRGRKPLTGPSS